MDEIKNSLTNKSVMFNEKYHAKTPIWNEPQMNYGPDDSLRNENIWDVLVVGNDGKEFYHCLLTLSDGTKQLVWVHKVWVVEPTITLIDRILQWLN